MIRKKLVLFFITSLMPILAHSAGNIAAGKAKASMCAGCHGANGISAIAGYPSLKGKSANFIVTSLKAYKNKTRKGGRSALMYPMASKLSNNDIKNIAAYYSSLK